MLRAHWNPRFLQSILKHWDTGSEADKALDIQAESKNIAVRI